jgi:hypothetical protein
MLSILRHFRKRKGRPEPDRSNNETDPNGAPTPFPADSLLRRIPPVKDRIIVIPIEKADCAGKWHKRRAILTSTSLILAREGDEYALEEIHLEFILGIQMVYETDLIGSQTRVGRDAESFLNRKDRVDNGRRQVAKEDGELPSVPKNLRRNSCNINSFKSMINLQESDGIEYLFDITTRAEELGSASRYLLRAANKRDLDALIRSLRQAQERYLANLPGTSKLQRLQGRLAGFYAEYTSWGVMAALIFINFFLDVIQAEMQPAPDSDAARAFHATDILFTCLFALDLLINLLAHSLLPFLRQGWNLLDLLVISLSIASLAMDNGSSGINSLRTIRAIRAVRLLKGVTKLREIVNAVISSVHSSSLPCSLPPSPFPSLGYI